MYLPRIWAEWEHNPSQATAKALVSQLFNFLYYLYYNMQYH